MNNVISIYIVRFIILILTQVLLLSHINFLGNINPYLYILFIILYPIKNNRMLFIFIAFLLGLCIDMFLDTGGIHALATLCIAYIRPVVLKFSFGSVYDHQTVKFSSIDFGKRLVYITILTFVHHLILFLLDVFNFSKIILVLTNTLYTSIFTIVLCILVSIIFSRSNKK